MMLACEIHHLHDIEGGSNALTDRIAASIQAVCKVRGDVKYEASGSLANDGKVIDDLRKLNT